MVRRLNGWEPDQVARVKGSGDIAYKGNPQEVDAPRKNIRQIK